MVGNVDHIDAVIDGDFGVFSRGDALDDEGHAGDFLDRVCHFPSEHRLKNASGLSPAARRLPAVEQRPLAPAVMRGVDSKAERHVASFLFPPDDIGAHIKTAEYVEL